VCLRGSFRGLGAFYFEIENEREILDTPLLTRITAQKQFETKGVQNMHHIQLLRNDANE